MPPASLASGHLEESVAIDGCFEAGGEHGHSARGVDRRPCRLLRDSRLSREVCDGEKPGREEQTAEAHSEPSFLAGACSERSISNFVATSSPRLSSLCGRRGGVSSSFAIRLRRACGLYVATLLMPPLSPPPFQGPRKTQSNSLTSTGRTVL